MKRILFILFLITFGVVVFIWFYKKPMLESNDKSRIENIAITKNGTNKKKNVSAKNNTKDSIPDAIDFEDLDISKLKVNSYIYIQNGKQKNVSNKSLFLIEIVPQNFFIKQKKQAELFINKQSNKQIKISNNNLKEEDWNYEEELSIRCIEKKLIFNDLSEKEAEEKGDPWLVEQYRYIGYIDALSSYLIQVSNYESYHYYLINQKTCKLKDSLIEYPILEKSAKRIYMISPISGQGGETDFQMYENTGSMLNLKASVYFQNYLFNMNPKEAFWSSDGFIYFETDEFNYDEKGKLLKTYNKYFRFKFLI